MERRVATGHEDESQRRAKAGPDSQGVRVGPALRYRRSPPSVLRSGTSARPPASPSLTFGLALWPHEILRTGKRPVAPLHGQSERQTYVVVARCGVLPCL